MKLVAWALGYIVFLALAITACGGGGGGSEGVVTLDGLTIPITDAAEGPYTLAGSVVHLEGDGLRLKNGSQTVTLNKGDTAFVFPEKLPAGSNFDVEIDQQPTGPNQVCTVGYGEGKAVATVRKVIVNCALPSRFAFLLDTNDVIKYDYDQNTGATSGGTRTRWTDSVFTTSYYSLTKHPIQPYIFVFHAYEHVLKAFHVDAATGALELKDTAMVAYDDGDAFRVRITPDGRYIYVGGKLNGVYGFEFDPVSGTMTPVAGGSPLVESGLAPDLVPLDDFEMDPNGVYVYGSNRQTGVSTLRIGEDGVLHYVSRYKGAHGVSMMSISPHGDYLFASSAEQSEIQVIKVDAGVLSQQVDIALSVNSDFWTGIQVDPTGRTVFVNERDAGVMGAYPVASLVGPSPNHFDGAAVTPTNTANRSFFTFSPNGRFVYSQMHDPSGGNATGMNGYVVDMARAPNALSASPLPPDAAKSLAFLVY